MKNLNREVFIQEIIFPIEISFQSVLTHQMFVIQGPDY